MYTQCRGSSYHKVRVLYLILWSGVEQPAWPRSLLQRTAGYRQAAEVIAAGWLPTVISQSIYGVSLKLCVMFRFAIYRDIKRHIPEKLSHIGYCRTDTRCWHHRTIRVQGIRNHFSPVTPLVSLNPLKSLGTFLIY